MAEAVWQVEIVRGNPKLAEGAPVKFGEPYVTLEPDGGVTDPVVPLILGPVAVHGHSGWLGIQTDDHANAHELSDGRVAIPTLTHREMALVNSIEFDSGYIRVEGAEVEPDGTLRYAVWHIEPYRGDVVAADDEAETGATGDAVITLWGTPIDIPPEPDAP